MKLQHILMAVTALAAAGLSQAQPADPLQVRSWAAACATCHGTQGHAQPGMIALAGTPQEVIVQKMLDFKAGRLPAATGDPLKGPFMRSFQASSPFLMLALISTPAPFTT